MAGALLNRFAVCQILFLVLLASAVDAATTEQMYVKNGRLAWNKSQGGLVVKDPDCGCPKGDDRPKWNSIESWEWPTRCQAENTYAGSGTYAPVDDWNTTYPSFTNGVGFDFPKGFPGAVMGGKGSPGVDIPFPGWPAAKPKSGQKVSIWNTTLRKQYKADYTQNGVKPPGFVNQGYQERSEDQRLGKSPFPPQKGWEYWQIHHILERKHNGTDDWGNFVPAYSYPNSKGKDTNSNKHNFYTQWWQQVRVDTEFHKDGDWFNSDTWQAIKDCELVAWPNPGRP